MLNNEQIEQVFAMSYQDEEQLAFKKKRCCYRKFKKGLILLSYIGRGNYEKEV